MDKSASEVVDSNFINSFEDLPLKGNLLRGYGFEKPTSLQSKCLYSLLNTKNIFIQAPYGSGKTTLYIIALLGRLELDSDQCQALVLAPTLEICEQISRTINYVGEYLGVSVKLCESKQEPKDPEGLHLKNNFHCAVGTPDTILEWMKKEWLFIENLKMVILDICDEILENNFQEYVTEIFSLLPAYKQTAFFSSLMANEVLKFMNSLLKDKIQVFTEDQGTNFDNIREFYILVHKVEWKSDAIAELVKKMETLQIIIYCNDSAKMKELAVVLNEINISVLSQDMSQDEIYLGLKNFWTGNSRILLSSDYFANAIKSYTTSNIINMDVPSSIQKYNRRARILCHQRYGDPIGTIINIIAPEEYQQLQEFEKENKSEIKEILINAVDDLF